MPSNSFVRRRVLQFAAASAAAGLGTVARGASGSWLSVTDPVAGSGKVTTEVRSASGFEAITLRSPMKLVLRQGGREGVELQGEDNLLPLVETRVLERDGVRTLEIGTRRGSSFSAHGKMVATVDFVTLRALAIDGSGDVTCDGLKSPDLVVTISGAGNVHIKRLEAGKLAVNVTGSGDLRFGGRTRRLAISISGSGGIDTRALEADAVSVDVAGSGAAKVIARKTLNVSIAGVGSVKYIGDPLVKSSIAGHGDVSKE